MCYIWLQGGKKGKKDDSGALYERWSKQQKRRVPVTGTVEAKSARFDSGLADRCELAVGLETCRWYCAAFIVASGILPGCQVHSTAARWAVCWTADSPAPPGRPANALSVRKHNHR